MIPASRVYGVLETCLYASDLDTTAAFYEDLIGLAVYSREAGRHVFFRCGEAMLLLFDPARTSVQDAGVPAHGARGAGHVCFAVADDAMDAWIVKLTAAGIRIEHEQSWPRGGRSIYVRDPAGNSVELASPRIWGLHDTIDDQDSGPGG